MVNFGDAAAYRRVCVRDVQCQEVCGLQSTYLPTVLFSDFNKEHYEVPEDDLKNGSKHVGAF
jgi:hypothetical protein